MTVLDLVTSVVAAINVDTAAGLGNFTVAASPDNLSLVLTSTPVGTPPNGKTEVFPVSSPATPV